VSIGFHAGARVPAHLVTPGVVLLARLPPAQLNAWADAHPFSGSTSHLSVDRNTFISLVEQARHTDHWITRQLLDPGLMGVAVTLVDRRGQCLAALGMTLQVQAWPDDSVQQKLLPALRETALTLLPLL
jgi:IclR family transcriptional regulator, pca regulon regulatory protein